MQDNAYLLNSALNKDGWFLLRSSDEFGKI